MLLPGAQQTRALDAEKKRSGMMAYRGVLGGRMGSWAVIAGVLIGFYATSARAVTCREGPTASPDTCSLPVGLGNFQGDKSMPLPICVRCTCEKESCVKHCRTALYARDVPEIARSCNLDLLPGPGQHHIDCMQIVFYQGRALL